MGIILTRIIPRRIDFENIEKAGSWFMVGEKPVRLF
jgi:hypothetical protein